MLLLATPTLAADAPRFEFQWGGQKENMSDLVGRGYQVAGVSSVYPGDGLAFMFTGNYDVIGQAIFLQKGASVYKCLDAIISKTTTFIVGCSQLTNPRIR